jgi:hypothetical protein
MAALGVRTRCGGVQVSCSGCGVVGAEGLLPRSGRLCQTYDSRHDQDVDGRLPKLRAERLDGHGVVPAAVGQLENAFTRDRPTLRLLRIMRSRYSGSNPSAYRG